jgi:hypothetical protein
MTAIARIVSSASGPSVDAETLKAIFIVLRGWFDGVPARRIARRRSEPRPFLDRAEDAHMLAEKFFLLLETLKNRSYADGGPRVVSSSPHIPVKLPQNQATADAGPKRLPSSRSG